MEEDFYFEMIKTIIVLNSTAATGAPSKQLKEAKESLETTVFMLLFLAKMVAMKNTVSAQRATLL